MGDFSEFFKRGFQNLKKQAIEKTYQQRSLKDRMEEFNQVRRQTRGSLMFQKRKIDEKNLTPYSTPEAEKPVKKIKQLNVTRIQKPNKRLEMLQKWKSEKEKKKELEKKKNKPIFKVYHIPVTVGLPNLETVNKEIKGKLINASQISKFAPDNHIFKPPANIKPLHFANPSTHPKINTLDSSRLNKRDVKVAAKSVSNSQLLQRSNSIKVHNKVETQKPKGTKSKLSVSKEAGVNTLHNSNISERNTRKRHFENKDNQKSADRKERASSLLDKKSNKTPQQTRSLNSKDQGSSLSARQKEKTKTVNSQENKEESKSLKQFGKVAQNKIKNESSPKTVKLNGRINIKSFSSNQASPLKSEPEIITESLNSKRKTPRKNKQNLLVQNEMSFNNITKENSDILYSDDEITLKTPRKTPMKTPRKTPMKMSEKTPGKTPRKTPGKTPLKVTPKIALKEQTPKTPLGSVKSSATYISPFVTVSRGKESARKEYKIRQSTGGSLPQTPEFGKFLTKATSPNAGADYFSNKLDSEINRIQRLCDKWLVCKDTDIPEEVKDMIDVAIGQSKLLMAKKFCQFKNLISECRDYTNKERPVTCMDLHGFWDTMYMQVEDINKRFNNLEVLKDNDWQIVIPEKKNKNKIVKNRPVRQTKVKASSRIKDMIKQARARKEKEVDNSGDNIKYEKPDLSEAVQDSDSKTRRSTRLSTLQSELVNARLSSSPGLTMMKITQAIKQGDGITPSSILKTNSRKSEKRMTKCVLFKDLEEDKNKHDLLEKYSDKENNFDIRNVQFSPVLSTRRSRRLTKN